MAIDDAIAGLLQYNEPYRKTDQTKGEYFGYAQTRRKRDAHFSSGTMPGRLVGKVLQLEFNREKPRISASSATNQAIGATRVQTITLTQEGKIEMKETGVPKEVASSVVSRDIGAMHAQTEMQERVPGEDKDEDEGAVEEEGAPPNLETAEGVGGEG
ncbi:hypothetical protein FRC06_001148 [Ceratobasidium sp. 370]|nr:hypothetical protein FRC06_001148 [Ceratobasidium sp. 370]